jgi:hypothetical protein
VVGQCRRSDVRESPRLKGVVSADSNSERDSAEARPQPINPDVRIAVASGVNTPRLVSEARRLGAEHQLAKPHTAETLLLTPAGTAGRFVHAGER